MPNANHTTLSSCGAIFASSKNREHRIYEILRSRFKGGSQDDVRICRACYVA
jgi:hypothetical protein